MKLSIFKSFFLVVLFSLLIPLGVNAADEHIVPSTYEDVGITTGIASDSDGNMYVVDNMNSKIMVFSPAGALISSIGRSGGADGDFADIIHEIAIDNNDYLYISGECHVYKFSPTGAFISRWGECGAEEGNFGSARGIHYDASQNRILVSDTSNHRVQVFTKKGIFVDSFGSFGTGEGQFDEPFGLTTDALGNIFVVDSNNHRVQKFDKDFNFIDTFGAAGASNGDFLFPKDIKIASNGNLIITSQNSQKIVIYSSALNFISQFGDPGGGVGQFSVPQYLELDSSNNIYVTDWYNNSIQKFTSAGAFVSIIGNGKKLDGSFFFPSAIAYDTVGNMYVLDDGAGAGRVQKFTNAGVYLDTIISENEGLYDSSYDMVIDGSDYIYISGESGVQVFNTAGVLQRAIGEYGTGAGQFTQARGMDFDATGNIYIADYFNSIVHVFDSAGTFVRSIGAQGDGAGQFVAPDAVLVDKVGEFVYVSDSNNGDVFPTELEIARIQKFDLAGNYISTIVTAGANWEDYNTITDLKMDDLGNIYVVDKEKHWVKYIDNTGTLLDTDGEYGSGLDEFYYPTGIAINPLNDEPSFADSSNHRIFLRPGGTRIADLSSEIDIIRVDNDKSITKGYVDSTDPDIANLEVVLYSTESPIANFHVDLTDDRDWSNVAISTLPEKAKVLVENLDVVNALGISATKDIYIPKYAGQEKLLVCPSATTIPDIELGCVGETILTTESAGVTVEVIEGQDYWVVADTDDNGFMSYSTTRLELNSTDKTIYINETLSVTIAPIADNDSLDTNYVGDVEVVSSPYVSVSHSVVPINKSAQPVSKEISFTEPGIYTLIAEDVDDPTLTDTLEDITVLGIQDEVIEEDNGDDSGSNNDYVYATRELSCEEDPAQDKCTVLAYIDEIDFDVLNDFTIRICWNQSLPATSFLQLTRNGQLFGNKVQSTTTDNLRFCGEVSGLTDSEEYGFTISISEVKATENVSGSYEGTFSMKDKTVTPITTDNTGKDVEEDKGGKNLKTILIIAGAVASAFIFFFIILKRRKKEEEEDNGYNQ